MENHLSHLISIFLHAGLAGLALVYQPQTTPLQKGDGLFVELREGPTPKGQSLIPPIEKPKPKKIKKKIKKVLVVDPKPTVTPPQKESAKVITQVSESPIQAAPEATQQSETGSPQITNSKFGVEDGIRDARLLQQIKGNPSPGYPAMDRLNKREGKVVVLGYINENGEVQRIRLESSTGTKRMNYNALKTFSRYRFEKGQQGWVRMPFQFVLKGPTQKVFNSRRRTDQRQIR